MTAEAGSLTERAYLELRRRIVLCDIAPGSTLSERGLARTTGFGLAPLRRALARLDHDGLVRTLPRSGYRVTALDADAVAELVDAWSVVGPEIVRRGLDAVAGDRRAELDELLSRRAAPDVPAVEARDALLFSETAMRTFDILAGACGNRWLRATFEQLAAQMSRVWIMLLRDPSSASELASLTHRWNDGVAGQSRDRVREELPRLIVDSGRIARRLVAPDGPS